MTITFMRYFRRGDELLTAPCDNDIVLVTIMVGGVWVSNPTVAMLLADGWEEYTPEPTPEPEPVEPFMEEMNYDE